MDTVSKLIRSACSLPLIGGVLALVIGFLPALIALPVLSSNTHIANMTIGVLVACWCYLLTRKNVINIVFPIVPIPLWIGGILMFLFGTYGLIANPGGAADGTLEQTDVVRHEARASDVNTLNTRLGSSTRKSSSENANSTVLEANSSGTSSRSEDRLPVGNQVNEAVMSQQEYEKKLRESQEAIEKLSELGDLLSVFGPQPSAASEASQESPGYENPADIPLSAEVTEEQAEARARAYLRKLEAE